MSFNDRGFLTPGESRKRKEREHFNSLSSNRKPSGEVTAVNNSSPTTSLRGSESGLHNNRLLAGYLAYEFLTEGTLFGQKFDQAGAEAMPFQSAGAQSRKAERSRKNKTEAEPNNGKANKLSSSSQSYAEVASLLKSDGTHIPGVVNPTDLARWFQL